MGLEEGLKVLAEHKILSAPVLRRPAGTQKIQFADDWPEDQPFPHVIGFAGVFDILGAILQELEDIVGAEDLEKGGILRVMRELEKRAPSIAAKELVHVRGTDGDFVFQEAAGKPLLQTIVRSFLVPHDVGTVPEEKVLPSLRTPDKSWKVHRLALYDEAGRLTTIVSQTDVIRFLLQHAAELGEVKDKTVEELRLGMPKNVFVISGDTSTLVAFDKMYKMGLTAAGVVEKKSGILVGNLSVADLRSTEFDQIGKLAVPVSEYLLLQKGVRRASRAESGLNKGNRNSFTGQVLATCSPDSTLLDVIESMVLHCVHHVYIVGNAGVAVGVVSPSDILDLLSLRTLW